MSSDLYAALDVPRSASVHELRTAFDRIRSCYAPSSPTYLAAAQAYAILGDPRLRAEYDAGRVVGTGVGHYFELSTSNGGSARATRGKVGRIDRLEARWRRRMAGYGRQIPPRLAQAGTRWPFVFLAGNASGFFITLIGIRLALGHPING